MKLFQQLLVAPAALGLIAPMAANAAELNLNGVSDYSHIIGASTVVISRSAARDTVAGQLVIFTDIRVFHSGLVSASRQMGV